VRTAEPTETAYCTRMAIHCKTDAVNASVAQTQASFRDCANWGQVLLISAFYRRNPLVLELKFPALTSRSFKNAPA